MRQAILPALCLFMALPAQAQTPSDCLVAVRITSTSFDQQKQETLAIKVTNVSPVDLKAFVLRLELLDSQGEVESAASEMELKSGGPSKSSHVLSPGESTEVEWQIPFLGSHPAQRLSADYVALVRDSSTARSTISTLQDWGPDQSHLSEQVKGMLSGLHDERSRLKQLTDAQGVTALSDDLESDHAASEVPLQRSEEFREGLKTACRLERQRLRSLLHQRGTGPVFSDLETDQ